MNKFSNPNGALVREGGGKTEKMLKGLEADMATVLFQMPQVVCKGYALSEDKGKAPLRASSQGAFPLSSTAPSQ